MVHKNLGPGLLESVYEKILFQELQKRSLKIVSQKSITFEYEGNVFPDAFRIVNNYPESGNQG
ncbi:GxxExxY protein [Leptospira koniambonensis]|uniref:GxxExxY protein n=1 Tax=Leptospira koniambonensis TaxID=2484950 RepID=UPI003EC0BB5F